MTRVRLFGVWAVAAAATGGAATGCGGGGIEGGCNPPCPTGWICVEGACLLQGDGADGADTIDFADVAPDDGGPRDDGGFEDEGREDVGPDDGGFEDEGREDVGPDDGGPRRGAIGDPCATPADCAGPTAECLVNVDLGWLGRLHFPGGYCSAPCGAGEACGPDAACIDARMWGGPANCMRTCGGASDCRAAEGYMCTNYGWFSTWFCGPPW